MKTITYFKSLVLSIAFSTLFSCSAPADFELLNGNQQRISDYHGKWLIINFWADWCAPCREEIPELNLFYQASKGSDFSIIGVSYDRIDNKKLRRTVKSLGIQYPVMATSPIPILNFKLPKTLPGNYIINPEGELVAKLTGTQTKQSLSKLLKSLRKKSDQTN